LESGPDGGCDRGANGRRWTLADAWRAEADFLAEPYKGSDAYETHDGLMAAMVSTFKGSDLKVKK
jgi:hypothetical protein